MSGAAVEKTARRRGRPGPGLWIASLGALAGVGMYVAIDVSAAAHVRPPEAAIGVERREDDGVEVLDFDLRDVRFGSDPFDRWLADEGMAWVPEQRDWLRSEVEETGLVVAGTVGGCARVGVVRPDDDGRSLGVVVWHGCDEDGRRRIAELRERSLRRPDAEEHAASPDERTIVEGPSAEDTTAYEGIPDLWWSDASVERSCEHRRDDRHRETADFDREGRLLRRRSWGVPPEERDGALWPWEVTVWSHEADGSIVRQTDRRPFSGPWDPATWIEGDPFTIRTRVEADLVVATWGEGERAEERSYRLEDGRLVEMAIPGGGARACAFDEAGRPTSTTEDGTTTTWRYEGGTLREQVVRFEGATVERRDVTLADDGWVLVGSERYRGDCAELVFEACSAIVWGLGRPLPDGLLPTGPR